MFSYKEIYLLLFNAITDALHEMERQNCGTAKDHPDPGAAGRGGAFYQRECGGMKKERHAPFLFACSVFTS